VGDPAKGDDWSEIAVRSETRIYYGGIERAIRYSSLATREGFNANLENPANTLEAPYVVREMSVSDLTN